MKLLRWIEWIAFAGSAPLVLFTAYTAGRILYVVGPALMNPRMLAEGKSAENGRGDVVENQVKDCALIDSAAQDRIGLKLADGEDFIAVVYYGESSNTTEPVFSWRDEDHLSVDLGEVDWLTPQVSQVGHVAISFTYSGAEPSLD